ncbi:uncharacterized protein LOC129594656 [Paramacrobiotus metropolitanus]|uniref:uncharacterized protein LOC129594656 n=1 Tax=Paramacrobiotus metropolitanus TaxID=2943436 RepID=UPI00244588BF|nr:uncharacterized protein LOC129594656 [Paramacrobiotus metropolitanus]
MALRSKPLLSIMEELRRLVQNVPLVMHTLRLCCMWYAAGVCGFGVVLTYIAIRRMRDAWYQKEVIFGFEFCSLYGMVLQMILAYSIAVILSSVTEGFDTNGNDEFEVQINKTLRRLRDCPVVFTAGWKYLHTEHRIYSVGVRHSDCVRFGPV